MDLQTPETSGSETDHKISDSALPKTLGWRFKATFGLLCVINLVCALDATILSVALPTIAQKLKGTAIQAFWTGTSYLLTSTVFQPTWASFSHIIGRKSVLMTAIIIFTVGSVICSVANNFTALITGRSIQGIGGGGIVALTYVIISDMVCLRDRGKWFGVISLQWAIGAATGPAIGGVFAEKNWRWIFWINIPFCAVGLIGLPFSLRLHLGTVMIVDNISDPIDVGRCFVSLDSLAYCPSSLYWWRGTGCISCTLSIHGEQSSHSRKHLLNYDRKRTYLCTTLHGIILWAVLYYMPLYFEVAKNYSPMKAGIALFPFTLTLGPASITVGVIISATGRYRPSVWIGWCFAALGTSLLIGLQESTSTAAWIILCLVPGLGYGILYPAMSFAVQAPASNADLPFAAAMFSFFRSLGQTLGVAIGGVIFQNIFSYKIKNYPLLHRFGKADEWSSDASALVEFIRILQNDQQDLKKGLVLVYVDALRVIWVVMAMLAFVAAVTSWFLTEEISLDRQLVTEQGFRHEGGDKKASDVEMNLGNHRQKEPDRNSQ